MTVSNVVYIHAKPAKDKYADLWYRGAGWYFKDEVGLLEGPHKTKELAEIECNRYAEYILGRGHA